MKIIKNISIMYSPSRIGHDGGSKPTFELVSMRFYQKRIRKSGSPADKGTFYNYELL